MFGKSILIYYWLTPLFWLLDELGGPNVRTAALEGHPWWKALYYLFCLAIPIAAHYRPAWTATLGIGETATNILLLALGVMVPYYRFIRDAAAGDIALTAPVTTESMVNFTLSAAVLAISLRVQLGWKPTKPFVLD